MRTFAMGDPQASFAKVREVLACHGALAASGDRLADDVVLVSIGDHFDYDVNDPVTAGAEGLKLLRWLAGHDAAQVVLLFGNHDAARVIELALLDDATFGAARTLARTIPGTAREAEFRAAYPTLPSSGVIGRDYAAFTVEQRTLVCELLLAGRFALARVGVLEDGREVLLSHAGVTHRELALLGLPLLVDANTIATRLAEQLATSVDAVRPAWTAGECAALSLAPLHVGGGAGEEGGGLLYHRPTNPASSKTDPKWAANVERPRRFDPRELPVGVTQVVGHTGHAKCTSELAVWATHAALARKHGGIRTLRVTERSVVYDVGVAPPAAHVTDMIFIDGELRRVPANEVALLRLARIHPAHRPR